MRRAERSSISTYPLADLGWKLLTGFTSSLAPDIASSFVRAKDRSFVPARRTSIASRAGAGKPAGRVGLAAGAAVAGRPFARAEQGGRIKRVGRLHRRSSSV